MTVTAAARIERSITQADFDRFEWLSARLPGTPEPLTRPEAGCAVFDAPLPADEALAVIGRYVENH